MLANFAIYPYGQIKPQYKTALTVLVNDLISSITFKFCGHTFKNGVAYLNVFVVPIDFHIKCVTCVKP